MVIKCVVIIKFVKNGRYRLDHQIEPNGAGTLRKGTKPVFHYQDCWVPCKWPRPWSKLILSFRNLLTPLAKCLAQSTTASSALFCTSTSCARSRFRASPDWMLLWSSTTSNTVSQRRESSRLANQTTVVKRLTVISLKECSTSQQSSLLRWMSSLSTSVQSMSCCLHFATYNMLFRTIQTCQMIIKD